MKKLTLFYNFKNIRNVKFGEALSLGLSLFILFFISQSAKANPADPGWLKLMRYEKTILGHESEVDSSAYFFAENGKNSPKAEMKASIVALSRPLTAVKDVNKHPRCQFPGRFLYLKNKSLINLEADFSMCSDYQTYKKKIDIDSIAVIFSSYYINKPASAFGHTFLKINSKAKNGNDFFSYGVDFSAQVTTSNPLMYGIGGIMGGFYGRFTLLPYFLKLREYNDFESRDLYEFKLNLSAKELELAEAHLWDMNNALFDYFYFTENCSYHVLRFIDAIAPQYDLMPESYFITVPVDTLYPLIENKGLTSEISFRASLQKRLNTLIEQTDAKQKSAIIKAYSDKSLEDFNKVNLDQKHKARALDIIAQFIDYKHASAIQLNSKDEDAVAIQDFKREVLIARSQIPLKATEFQNKVTLEKIDLGHRARRVNLSSVSDNDRIGINIQNRTALHQVTDRSGDVFSTFSLEMGKLDLDFFETKKAHLNRAELATVLALRPWNLLEKTFSWNFAVGLGNSREYEEITSPYLDLGLGFATHVLDSLVGYLAVDSRFRHISRQGYIRESLVGGKYSLFFTTDAIRATLAAGYYQDLESHREFNIIDYNFNYSINKSVSLISSGEYDPKEYRTQLGLALYY